jgi:prophage antirepressor-like protein
MNSKMINEIVPFEFKGKEIRVVKDEWGELWWVAKDVCEVLEHSNPTVAMEMLDDDERCLRKVYPPGRPEGVEVNVVSESGLYTLIIRSNKLQAKAFRRWVTHEVLPAIRKTGTYSIPRGMALVSIFNLSSQMIVDHCRKWIEESKAPFTIREMQRVIDKDFPCGISHCQTAVRIERSCGHIVEVPKEFRRTGKPEYLSLKAYKIFYERQLEIE